MLLQGFLAIEQLLTIFYGTLKKHCYLSTCVVNILI